MSKPLWKVELEGEREDLLALSRCFTDPACRVEGGSDRFYLTSTQFDADPQSFVPAPQRKDSLDMRPPRAADAVRHVAEELLIRINGVASLEFVPYEAVSLGTIYGFYPGVRQPFVTVSVGGSIRTAWTSEFPNTSPNLLRWFDHAQRDARVWEALELYGQRPYSDRERCRSLYVVFEIVRSAVGNEKLMAAQGWASHNEIKDCRQYLNLARHPPHIGGQPPKLVKHLWEAESIMRKVVQGWVEQRIAGAGPAGGRPSTALASHPVVGRS